MLDKLKMKVIPFARWRREIAPLWSMEGGEKYISPTIDGFDQMQYVGKERFRSVLCFPIEAELDGERVGWTSIFNISDEALRVRGIYVLPDRRSRGVGYAMVMHAIGLWPLPWRWVYMYARQANIERFLKWGFVPAPLHRSRTWENAAVPNPSEILLMRKAIRQDVNASSITA
jgi:GNAT superfamily N-acetyltransferase